MLKLLSTMVALVAQSVICAQLVNLNNNLICSDKDCESTGFDTQEATVRQDGDIDRFEPAGFGTQEATVRQDGDMDRFEPAGFGTHQEATARLDSHVDRFLA